MDASAAISELVIANRVVAHLKLVDSFGHVTYAIRKIRSGSSCRGRARRAS